MRNFRNAAVASTAAIALAAAGTTVAVADTVSSDNKPAYSTEETAPNHNYTGGPKDVVFKGDKVDGDRPLKEVVSKGIEGLFNGQGATQFLPDSDRDQKFYGIDAFGKETYFERIPQWGRLWIDGTVVSGIGAVIGLVIAAFNYAAYNGWISVPQMPQINL